MKHAFKFALLALGLLVSVVGVSQSTPPDQVTVDLKVTSGYGTSVSFEQQAVSVSQGGTVTWINPSSREVKLISSQAGFNGTVPPNGSFSQTFSFQGVYLVVAQVGNADDSMMVAVQAGAAGSGELQQFALLHDLERLQIHPSTLVIRKDIPVRLLNMGLGTIDFHGPIEIRDAETGQRAFNLVGDFSARPGTIQTTEFIPDRTGTFTITHAPHGHDITGTLIVVEDYPSVLQALRELGQLELAVIHSLSDLAIFPEEVFVFEGLPLTLYNTAKDGQHNPVQIVDKQTQLPSTLTVDGAVDVAGFQIAPNQLSVVEFLSDQAAEFEITHLLHGHPITGALIVIKEEE